MSRSVQNHGMRIAGETVGTERNDDRCLAVFNPFTGQCIASVPKATIAEVQRAFALAHAHKPTLTRFERAAILNRCAALVIERSASLAALIVSESGLCLKDALYETGRVADVLAFGASECLRDDGQIFSCDLTPHGRQRRVYTQRSPLLGVNGVVIIAHGSSTPLAMKNALRVATEMIQKSVNPLIEEMIGNLD